MRRCAATILVLFGTLLCGCRSAPQEGERVALVRDLMVESAKLTAGPERSEGAERAVRVWRGQSDGGEG